MTLSIGDQAPDVSLRDQDDRPVQLADLWQTAPLVLLFQRHVGWTFCREHVVDVRDDHSRFVEARGQVAVVTMSNVDRAAAFHRRFKLPFACLADPDQQAYRAFGLPRGSLLQIAGPSVWLPGLKSLFRIGLGRPSGDLRQMSGTFIIDRDGIVQLAHPAAHSADRPSNDELIRVLEHMSDDSDSGDS